MSLRLENGRDRVAVVEERIRIVPTYDAGEQHVELLGLDNAQEGDRHTVLLSIGGRDEPLPAHRLLREARVDVGQPLLLPAVAGCASDVEVLTRGEEVETDGGQRVRRVGGHIEREQSDVRRDDTFGSSL